MVEGGCDGPFDLWLVDVNGGEPKPVARGIDRAALRWPDPPPRPGPRTWPRWAGRPASKSPCRGRPPGPGWGILAPCWIDSMEWLRARPLRPTGCWPCCWPRCRWSRSPTPGGNATGTATWAAPPWSWCWPRRRWWRRRRPLAVALTTGLATAAYGFAHYPDLAMPIAIGGVVGMYSVAAWGGRRAALLSGAVAAVVVAVVMTLPRADADVVDAAFVSLALAGAWVLGDRARVQRALAAELQERAARLEGSGPRTPAGRWPPSAPGSPASSTTWSPTTSA